MRDQEIVELYWLRDETAISATEETYGQYLSVIAHNILHNAEDASESVNDTYLAAWNSIPPHKPNVLSTYLGKITRRISIDRFRKKHRQKRIASEYAVSLDELSDCVNDNATPVETAEVKLLAEKISNFLRAQSADARRVFVARYYFLDPLKDIASYCGMSEAKVKTLLFRTRTKLKDYLQKEGFSV